METVEIVRVKFLWPGQIQEFVNPEGLALRKKDQVVVKGFHGGTLVGSVAVPPRVRERRNEDGQLTPVVRLATDQDVQLANVSNGFRQEVKAFFETRIRARNLAGVKLVDCEKADDGRRLIVYFLSEQRRFDARELAMEIGHKFSMRVDMRPVGVRDAARLAGGIGKCGLSLCCSTWLPDFQHVSIRMAKDQGLSLDPESINGQCGRLLCCLGYEHENYVALGKNMPKVGKIVVTPIGDARVVKLDILGGTVTVRAEDGRHENFPSDAVRRKFGPGGGRDEPDEEEVTPE